MSNLETAMWLYVLIGACVGLVLIKPLLKRHSAGEARFVAWSFASFWLVYAGVAVALWFRSALLNEWKENKTMKELIWDWIKLAGAVIASAMIVGLAWGSPGNDARAALALAVAVDAVRTCGDNCECGCECGCEEGSPCSCAIKARRRAIIKRPKTIIKVAGSSSSRPAIRVRMFSQPSFQPVFRMGGGCSSGSCR